MLSIRFSKVGKRNRPEFRLIVVDKHKDPWGKAVEILGSRNPRTKANVFNLDRIKYWLSQGAQPSATVHNLLVDLKLVEGKKQSVTNISNNRTAKMAKEAGEKKKKEETPAA
ncbi:MAG: 30S ribosomal protein S16 [Patescibacteria group bacterium]|jgi:small subunit ribosomal protein S16